jgi:sigma54-dependent transcription regulator
MTEAQFFPGRLVQTSRSRRASSKNPGEYTPIDLDLSRYDQLAQRFSLVHAEGIAFLKSGIATRNAELNRMIEEIERVAINLLAQFSEENASKMRFNRGYRARFMRFAVSPEALWSGNFRDLHASVTRMATLSKSGLITDRVVDDEIARLTRLWRHGHALVAGDELTSFLGEEGAAQLDRFDAVQLQEMIAVCRTARSLSKAGCYCSPCRARPKPNRTMPTGSRNTWPALTWTGTRSAMNGLLREHHVLQLRDVNLPLAHGNEHPVGAQEIGAEYHDFA